MAAADYQLIRITIDTSPFVSLGIIHLAVDRLANANKHHNVTCMKYLATRK